MKSRKSSRKEKNIQSVTTATQTEQGRSELYQTELANTTKTSFKPICKWARDCVFITKNFQATPSLNLSGRFFKCRLPISDYIISHCRDYINCWRPQNLKLETPAVQQGNALQFPFLLFFHLLLLAPTRNPAVQCTGCRQRAVFIISLVCLK